MLPVRHVFNRSNAALKAMTQQTCGSASARSHRRAAKARLALDPAIPQQRCWHAPTYGSISVSKSRAVFVSVEVSVNSFFFISNNFKITQPKCPNQLP